MRCVLLLGLVLTGCRWSGWKYYDPGTEKGAGNDASLIGGLGGGAVCAEWAYDRDLLHAPEAPAGKADAGLELERARWLPKGWCEPPRGQALLIPCDGGAP